MLPVWHHITRILRTVEAVRLPALNAAYGARIYRQAVFRPQSAFALVVDGRAEDEKQPSGNACDIDYIQCCSVVFANRNWRFASIP
jgi:hypothetical protein